MQTRKYIVSLWTEDLSRQQRVEDQLKEFGQVQPLGDKVNKVVWELTTDEKHDAKTIRDSIRPLVDIFYDIIFVARYYPIDRAMTNLTLADVSESKGIDDIDGKRNFNRFGSRMEAKAAYERERPNWWMKYGGGSSVPVGFEEWLWLPIRKDGIYERGENERYL